MLETINYNKVILIFSRFKFSNQNTFNVGLIQQKTNKTKRKYIRAHWPNQTKYQCILTYSVFVILKV